MTDSDDWRPGAAPEVSGGASRGDEILLAPVGAVVSTRRNRIAGRILAVAISLALVGGGAVLAISAGGSSGGADSPEAAVEDFLVSLSSEDLLGAAETIEPTERATLIDGGMSLADELTRLDVISADLDLSAVVGVDLLFENFTLRSVPAGAGVSHVFVTRGSSRASVDVSRLPLGRILIKQAPANWLAFTDSVISPISPSEPVVAVERGGRWYVSLLYSAAESARIAADRPPPSVDDRPVPIGAQSPEAAVERLVGELLRVDPRRVIGMLDPDEMAALYHYSTLFLDEAESAANDLLQYSADNEISWNLDSITLSSSVQDDFATVAVHKLQATLSTREFTGQMVMEAGRVEVDLTAVDPDGAPTLTRVGFGNGCTTVDWVGFTGPDTFDSCDRGADEFAPIGVFALLAAVENLGPLIATPTESRLVTHRVDDRWFVSPLRTGVGAAIGLLRTLTPEVLGRSIEAIKASTLTMPGGFSTGIVEARLLPFTHEDNRFVSDFDLRSDDLVNARAPAAFAVDHVSVLAESILAGWLPELAGTRVVRAVEIDWVSKVGGVMVFVMQLADSGSAADAIDILLRSPNWKSNGSLLESANSQRAPIAATAVSDRLIFAAGFLETPVELVRAVIARQIPE